MNHCRGARAFLHCSSTAVYQPDGHRRFKETDPLGDNHRPMSFLSTYSISKISAEAMARFCARQLSLPTTIARLNVPYGDRGGWPAYQVAMMLGGMAIGVHADAPCEYNPIHDDDIVAMIPGLLAAASVPATILNWGGDDVVSVEEWCAYLGGLVGVEPTFETSAEALPSVAVDLTELHRVVGHSTVPWRDGMRRLVENLYPDKLVG